MHKGVDVFQKVYLVADHESELVHHATCELLDQFFIGCVQDASGDLFPVVEGRVSLSSSGPRP